MYIEYDLSECWGIYLKSEVYNGIAQNASI